MYKNVLNNWREFVNCMPTNILFRSHSAIVCGFRERAILFTDEWPEFNHGPDNLIFFQYDE